MPTYQQLASKYAARLREANDRRAELRLVAVEINSLVDATGNRLLRADKLEIAELIMRSLAPGMTVKPRNIADVPNIREGENKHYLEVVKTLRGLLG